MLRVQTEILRAYSALRDRVEREEGQALVEYALILALIAVVSILILQALGLNVSRVFNTVNSQISTVVP
jgi:Flp pilus assembly pilin Flp